MKQLVTLHHVFFVQGGEWGSPSPRAAAENVLAHRGDVIRLMSRTGWKSKSIEHSRLYEHVKRSFRKAR